MLGPNTPDEFGKFAQYTPPALRSQIDNFRIEDAKSVLDGDMTPEERRDIANNVRAALRGRSDMPRLPHGGHRHGTGWGKEEFDPGVGEGGVVDWVRAIIDDPADVRPAPWGVGFIVAGVYRGTRGEVVVRHAGENAWIIVTSYPKR